MAEPLVHISTKCVCDAKLTEIKDLSVFVVENGYLLVWCSNCNTRMDEINGSFWHCPQDYNFIHPDGYNICCECITQDLDTPSKNEQTTQTQNSQKEEISCKVSIDCDILQNFIKIMNDFSKSQKKISADMEDEILKSVYNNYMHVLRHHDSSVQYKTIFDLLQPCNISDCTIFYRNKRNRKNDDNMRNNTDILNGYNCACSIMDMMHCYFHHSYDTGYRLQIQNKSTTTHAEQKDDVNDNKMLVNEDIVQCQSIHKNSQLRFDDKRHTKYTQLFADDDKKQNTEVQDINAENAEMYSFGYRFKYGYKGEAETHKKIEHVDVSPSHSSLKEELIDNKYAINQLTKEQYDIEYKKSMIFFNSQYCKQHKYFQTYTSEYDAKVYQTVPWEFKQEYLLVVIIYCNYTQFQAEFSRTYREKNGANHHFFYFWGRNLKIFLRQFGTPLSGQSDGVANALYHGISNKVYFPQYVNTGQQCGIQINCPLSTSASFEIAAMFSLNKGFIIELKENAETLTNPVDLTSAKYISAAWLSDFPAEKEHLFVQNYGRVGIYDIIDVTSGYQYKWILEASRSIHDVLNNATIADYKHGLVQVSSEKFRDGFQILCKAILEDALSETISKYKRFSSLSSFSRHILSTMFQQQNQADIHYWRVRKHYSYISNFFIHSAYEWVNLEMLSVLFPNIQMLNVTNVNLSPLIFENILKHFANNKSSVERISISGIKIKSDISMEEAVQKFSMGCRKLKLFIYQMWIDDVERHIVIKKCEDLEIIKTIIVNMNKIYYVDPGDEIELKMQNLIKNQLNPSDAKDNEEQMSFNEWCFNFDSAFIDWKVLAQKSDSCLFKTLCYKNIEGWVDLQVLNELFPNIGFALIERGNFGSAIMEIIYNHLISAESTFNDIYIADPVKCTMSMDKAAVYYKEKFEAIKWMIRYSDIANSKCLTLQMFE